MRAKRPRALALPVLAMLAVALLTSYSYIQPAHAGGSIVQATGNPAVCTSSCSASYGSNVAAGNFLVAFLQANAGAAVTCGTIAVSSISDTLASTWSQAASDCIQTADVNSFIEIAKAAGSGADQVNVAFSGTVFNNGGQMEIFEISGAPAFTYISGNGHSISTTAASMANSIALGSSYFSIASLTASTCSTAQGGQTRYAFLGGANCWTNVGAGIGSTTIGYAIESALSSPTNLPFTASVADWSEVGIIFGNTATVSSVVIVPCTAFELQCWLYPMFVFGIYLIIIVGAARLLSVPRSHYTGHLLEAFSLAGMVCVLFGILNVMVPLMITVLQVVRTIRE